MKIEPHIVDFLTADQEEVYSYTHRTVSREIADKILSEGLRYQDAFQKTTDEIQADPVYLNYWDTVRKSYGPYTVVIGIARAVLDKAQDMIISRIEAQQLLGTTYEEDNEVYHLLPNHYVKGYFETMNNTVVLNPAYAPFYEPPDLEYRLDQLRNMS